ncbi:MAG: AraC family transcriptional regulator ligand-binding domain-containing protein [Gammaproteobacteria bacterium]|nr:AraC family transcriptional regulator ligand-binding domain-containing protein [Gammaproteobacteria bacterium]
MFSDIYFRLLLEVMERDSHIQSIPKLIDDAKRAELNSVRNFYLLIRSAYQQYPQTNIGFEFGGHIKPINACDFSRLITTADTVYAAFSLLVDQYPRLSLKVFPQLYRNERDLSIALSTPSEYLLKDGYRRFSSETFFRYCMSILKDLTDREVKPKKIYFDYPKPKYADEYQRIFACELVFDAPLAMIVFDEAIADTALSSRNPYLHDVYLMKSQETWQGMKRQQSFRYRAISQMMQGYPKSFNSQWLAQSLNISTRGLQKRLSAEGSSFSAILQVVRREITKICLYQKHEDFDEVGKNLGFQTQASFRKFFKQQFGISPRMLEESICEEPIN